MEYSVTNLDSLYEALGEKRVQEILNEFECNKNIEVEKFLKEKAILLSKQGISKTYIVTTSVKEKDIIVGYFSIANKQVCEVQKMIGGRFVFLECEDIQKLKDFYESNGFMCYNKRKLEKYERQNNVKYLLQMICDLSNF